MKNQATSEMLSDTGQDSILQRAAYRSATITAYGVYGQQFSVVARETLGFQGETLMTCGLYLLGNGYRGYSPALMRFVSPDSYSPFRARALNSYTFCGADPVNHTDPDGHFWRRLRNRLMPRFGLTARGAIHRSAQPLPTAALEQQQPEARPYPPPYISPPPRYSVSNSAAGNVRSVGEPPPYTQLPRFGEAVLEWKGDRLEVVEPLLARPRPVELRELTSPSFSRLIAINRHLGHVQRRQPMQTDNGIRDAVRAAEAVRVDSLRWKGQVRPE